MMFATFQVALGGAIGAVLRFLLGLALLRPGFPLGVLTANVVGCLLMGIAVVLLGRNAPEWQPFILTGVLGGFTTFSAFSLETITLIERGDVGQALSYVALSVGLSLAAIWLGVTFARSLA